MTSIKFRIAPRTAVLSSTRSSQGLRPLVIEAKTYYGSSPKTIRKFVFFRLEAAPAIVGVTVGESFPTGRLGGLIFSEELEALWRGHRHASGSIPLIGKHFPA